MPCYKASEYNWCAAHPANCSDKDGNNYCVYHAPAKDKGISVLQFNDQVATLISNTWATKQECDLSGTIFPGKVDFSTLFKTIVWPHRCMLQLRESQFLGSVSWANASLSRVVFESAIFCEKADFSNTAFLGLNFGSSEFKKGAIFEKASFNGNAIFSGAEFSMEACFASASTAPNMNIYFAGTRFLGSSSFVAFDSGGSSHVDFDRAIFEGHADFTGAKAPGVNTSFRQTVFKDGNLNDVSLGQADLSGAVLDGADLTKAGLTGANLCTASLRNSILDSADFKKAKLMLADLKGTSIKGTWFNQGNLARADFRGATGRASWMEAKIDGIVLDRTVLRTIPIEYYESVIHSIVVEGLPPTG